MTRALVLLHGFTGAPASWDEVREALEDEGAPPRILAPAAIGHGGTPGSPEPPDPSAADAPTGRRNPFEAEVDRLADVVEREGFRGAHLAGYSMGGRLAVGLLARHPSLFSGATLIGASPGLPASPPEDPAHAAAEERRKRAEWDEEWARLLESEGLSTFVAAWEALPMFASQRALAPDRRAAQDRIRRAHDARGLATSLRAIGLSRMPDYRPRLAAIPVPVRLVVGARDAKFRGLAEEMARRMPRAEIVVVEDVGHNVVLERPAEVARLIREGMERT